MTQPENLGKWKLANRLAGGGQSEIYEATCGEGEPICALKLIKASYPKKRARFIQEIRKHKELTERGAPNIIPLLDSNLEDLERGEELGFIVMPKARTNLDKQIPLLMRSPELCLDIFRGIVCGIKEAHTIGVIHRDLKPANILFMDESLATPLVADFGICFLKGTRDQERLTEENETTGSKFFKAPEQDRGRIVDVKETVDIYSLGKVLHKMLTGRYLFREMLEEAFRPQEMEKDPRLAIILEKILSRTVVLDSNQRIQNAQDLLEITDELITQFKGQIANPPKTSTTPVTPLSSADSQNGKISESYHETIKYLDLGKLDLIRIQFDTHRKSLRETYEALWSSIKDNYGRAPEAAIEFMKSQPRLTGMVLALVRLNKKEFFQDFKGLLEYITTLSREKSGYMAIISVPYVYAGFLYMSASVIALFFQSWDIVYDLLNSKFEWYYQSGRPLYSYGFNHSYFFHPEALQTNAAKTHDLFRDELSNPEILNVLGIDKDELFNAYLQMQMIMSLKTVKVLENESVFPVFPDFGRFNGYRVLKLLDKAYNDRSFAEGICKSFNETPEEWFSKLNERLAIVRRWFKDASYFWSSIDSYEPR
jgi:serine/threonine protein kinase